MDSPLALYLTRFSLEPSPEPVPEVEEVPETVDPEPEPEIDLVALEHETQLAETRAEMAAEAEARLDALRAEHAEAQARALDEAYATWTQTQAVPLAARIEESFDALRAELDARVADALLPLLSAAVVAKAQAAVSESLDRLTEDPAHPPLTLHGPAELVDAIRRERRDARGLDYVVTDEVDMRVTATGVRIAARLSSALAALYADGPGDAKGPSDAKGAE